MKKTRVRKCRETEPDATDNIIYIVEEESKGDDEDGNEVVTDSGDKSSSEILTKKRGRKPKGGKIVTKTMNNQNSAHTVSNVILHLKCSTQDLNDYNTQMTKKITDPLTYNPSVPPNIMTYNVADTSVFSSYNESESFSQTNYAYMETLPKILPTAIDSATIKDGHTTEPESEKKTCEEIEELDDDTNIKDIHSKLKKMKINLYKNTLNDKKSACFWCTYPFDNLVCYIPKYEMDGNLAGYGSFCRPECAVAYLMKENIDDSTKFERYHLLNRIYSKIYNYNKNIKPAPNPYYLLDKFYGNLSIQEYRKLLKTEHMLLVIDKPLTRILPELHEDNEEFILNMYRNKPPNSSVNTTGVYKVKKQSEKPAGPSKNSIMRDNFGLTNYT